MLVYTNLYKVDGKILNLEYNFSDKFNIAYDETTNRIIINEKKSIIPHDFFGENVRRVNAIINKNRTEKSTLIEKLESRDLEPVEYPAKNSLDNIFFSIYEFNGTFYSEGIYPNVRYQLGNTAGQIDKFKEFNSGKNVNYISYSKTSNTLTPLKKDKIKFLLYNTSLEKLTYSLYPSDATPVKESNNILPYINAIYEKKENDDSNRDKFILSYLVNIVIKLAEQSQHLRRTKEYQKLEKKIRKLKEDFMKNNLENFSREEYLLSIYNIFIQSFHPHLKDKTHKIEKLLRNIPENYFKLYKSSQSRLIIDINENNIKLSNLIELLKLIDLSEIKNVFQEEIIGLSDGQESLINLCLFLKKEIDSFKDQKYIHILLDDPGSSLHPEWNRQLLNYVINFLNRNYKNKEFIILIATHSPMVLSDLPKSYILKVISKNGKTTVEKEEGGYGENIYEIMKDSFYLNSYIGEFAKFKMNHLLERIQSEVLIPQQVPDIERELNLIEDIFLKNTLKRELRNATQEFSSLDEEIVALQKELKKLEKKKQQKEMNNHDDSFE